MKDPLKPWTPKPQKQTEVEVVRDFSGIALGTLIREADGQVVAKDSSYRTIGRFDGRKTVDGVGRPLMPGDITKTLVLDAAAKSGRRRF